MLNALGVVLCISRMSSIWSKEQRGVVISYGVEILRIRFVFRQATFRFPSMQLFVLRIILLIVLLLSVWFSITNMQKKQSSFGDFVKTVLRHKTRAPYPE